MLTSKYSVPVMVLVVAVTLSACGGKETEPPAAQSTVERTLPFDPAIFVQDDSFTYSLVNKSSGAKVGESTVAVSKTADGNVRITSSADNSDVTIDGNTLKPIRSHNVVDMGGRYDIRIEFTDKEARIDADTPRGKQQATVRLLENVYHNDSILMIVRGMDFTIGNEVRIHDYIALNSQQIPMSIRVTGEEKVTVPAGEFDTYHVQLDAGVQMQDCWYEKQLPHRLVQYDNGRILMKLAETAAG